MGLILFPLKIKNVDKFSFSFKATNYKTCYQANCKSMAGHAQAKSASASQEEKLLVIMGH
jgi:hypothetical protein